MSRFRAVAVSTEHPNGLKPYTAAEETARDAEEAALNSVDSRKKRLIIKCKEGRNSKTYTNETIPFPVIEHEIKTSNEVDIRNLISKMLAATALIAAGGGDGDYRYITAAKVRVSLTVQQFCTAALAIMAIKDAIFYQYDDLRLLIDAATTQAALDDIEDDWPA